MGFFSRFFKLDDNSSKLDAGPTEPSLSAREAADIRAQIDIDAAIAAHEKWKERLQDLLDGKATEKLDPVTVCLDYRCELGQWLHGPGGQRLGKYPAFQVLIDRHRYFHEQAAAVVVEAQAGNAESALKIFNSAYKYASSQVNLLLKELKRGLAIG